MSTHKHFDKICCVVLALTLLLTGLFMCGESLGVQKTDAVMGYEDRLFNTSSVHTIDIVMDDWDSFIETCTTEEYAPCTVVIDGEAYKNVAIRAKGNTSLTQVQSYGNDRYSFKIEFDRYDSAKTYYGLDKLCLNNIIQDNTYMKDYLTYRMMGQFGVASPLCSYTGITVNGEAWGLYLAVEGVEEAFLQRNYGTDYGELYKPDSMNMGGGRGNGRDFHMDDWKGLDSDADNAVSDGSVGFNNENGPVSDIFPSQNGGGMQRPDTNGFGGGMQMPGEMGGHGMGSNDVSLIYSDDEYDSYSNIFDNAKTDITDADKDRLIAALKNINENTDPESSVGVESVIRYFAVHNFVLNFDSYTGSMIHNYYLYEKDGALSMIPWDYNLAFGGFRSADGATSLVNYPIDSPISGGNTEDRPMIAWIFANEKYTELYHQYFAEFISEYFDSGYFEEMIDSVLSMIAPYVEKDPTKFCTYEEFETGVSTLKKFCLLRAESVAAQLNGTIGSTSDTQSNDTLIDASDLQITDMGSMNNSMGGGMDMPDGNMGGNRNQPNGTAGSNVPGPPSDNSTQPGSPPDQSQTPPAIPGSNADGPMADVTPPQFTNGEMPSDSDNRGGRLPGGMQLTDSNKFGSSSDQPFGREGQSANGIASRILLSITAIILISGLVFAFLFKKRR